jgi:transposase
MNRLSLTPWQRRQLQRQLKQTLDAHVYRRTLGILEVGRGQSITQIARTLGVTRQSVYNWIADYSSTNDPTVLEDAERPGRPSRWTDPLRVLLQSLMNQSPQQLGYFAVDWTVPLLQEHLRHCTGQWLSDDTIRRELQRLRYLWKRSRYVLDPDPEEEKKKTHPPPDREFAGSERPAG